MKRLGRKLQIPNSKLQRSTKHQIPNTDLQTAPPSHLVCRLPSRRHFALALHWSLGFGASLELGSWSLGFSETMEAGSRHVKRKRTAQCLTPATGHLSSRRLNQAMQTLAATEPA